MDLTGEAGGRPDPASGGGTGRPVTTRLWGEGEGLVVGLREGALGVLRETLWWWWWGGGGGYVRVDEIERLIGAFGISKCL